MTLINNIMKFELNKEKIDIFNIRLIFIYLGMLMLPRLFSDLLNKCLVSIFLYSIYAIMFVPLLYVVIYNIKNKYQKYTLDILLLTIYVVFCFISVIFSNNPYYSFLGTIIRHDGFISLIIYYFLYINARNIKNEKHVETIMNVLFIYAIISTIFALINVYIPATSILYLKAFKNMGYGLQGNPNFYATYTLLFTLIGLYKCLFQEHTKFHVFATIFIFVGLILSNSTGPFLTFAFLFLILMVYIIIKRKYLFSKIVIWSFIFLFLFITIECSSICINKYLYHIEIEDRTTLLDDISDASKLIFNKFVNNNITNQINNTNPNLDEITSNRITIWKDTYNEVIKKHVWFGVGIDNLSMYKLIYKNGEKVNMVYIDKAHNIYINMIAETGIISFLVYIAWMIYYHVKAIKSKKSIVYLLLFAIIGYNIQGFFNINVIYVVPYYYILVGMMLGLSEVDQIETRKH